jgi:hypothetical protein
MEVHHHPHIPTHAKPWKEYLLEGLMIFVAVTLGYGAENIREHYVETKKAIISAKNLYVDVLADSATYQQFLKNRARQDSCYEIVNEIYKKKILDNEVPTLYAAHSQISKRMLPIMNTLALDEVKNSGTLKFIEDEKLKIEIQKYASMGGGLKLREQREFNFIDKMIDPISINNFKYDFYGYISSADNSFKIVNGKIIINIPVPSDLKIMKENELDWDYYFSVLGMLKTIRESTNKSYIIKTQTKCHELLTLLRNYLMEHDALENNHH